MPNRFAARAAAILALSLLLHSGGAAQDAASGGEASGTTGFDPAAEQFLYRGATAIEAPDTYFPGAGPAHEDPATRLARESYVRGALLAEKGNPVKAFERFREAATRDPENVWLRLRAIDAAIMLSDFGYAQEAASDILRFDPDNTRVMFRLGQVALIRDRVREAEEWFRRVLEREPRQVDALAAMAQIAFEHYRDLEATKEYSGRILKVTNLHLQAMLWNAQANALTGDVATAADLYERLLSYRPQLIMQVEDMARQLMLRGRQEDAMLLYRRAIRMAPSAQNVRFAWEEQLRRRGGDAAVREGYLQLLAEHENDLDVQELYAEYLTRTGDLLALRALRESMLKAEPMYVPALIDLARLSLDAGDTARADEFVQRTLAAGPDNSDVYRQLAELYLRRRKDLDRAATLLERAVALNPRDARSLLLLGLIAEERKDFLAAEARLRDALAAAPAQKEPLRALGDFFLRRERLREATDVLEQVMAIDPEDREVRLRLAQLFFEADNARGLDRVEAAVAAASPANDTFLAQYGILARQYGQFERARKALERVVESIPGYAQVRFELAACYAHLNRRDLADRLVQQGRSLATDSVSKAGYLRGLIDYAEHVGDPALHVDAWRELSELEPGEFSTQEGYTLALADAGRTEEALRQLEETKTRFALRNPEQVKLLEAGTLVRTGSPDRALAILDGMLKDMPDDTGILFQKAFVANEAGRGELAESLYRKVLEKLGEADEENSSLVALSSNNLAYMLAKRGEKLEEALELAKEARRLNRRAPYVMDTYGYILFRLGRLDEAQKLLEEAARLTLSDAEIHSNLGDLYTAMGRLDAAKASYERAKAIDPDLEGLREKLAQVESGGKKPQ
jgi:tetratricopeptide (TPR) repeat protein